MLKTPLVSLVLFVLSHINSSVAADLLLHPGAERIERPRTVRDPALLGERDLGERPPVVLEDRVVAEPLLSSGGDDRPEEFPPKNPDPVLARERYRRLEPGAPVLHPFHEFQDAGVPDGVVDVGGIRPREPVERIDKKPGIIGDQRLGKRPVGKLRLSARDLPDIGVAELRTRERHVLDLKHP